MEVQAKNVLDFIENRVVIRMMKLLIKVIYLIIIEPLISICKMVLM